MHPHDRKRTPPAAWLVVLALALLLVTAGCGESGQPTTGAGQPTVTQAQTAVATRPAEPTPDDERASSDISACELLTKEEVAAAMGEPVEDTDDSGLRGCVWDTGDRTQILLDVFSGSMLAGGTCAAQQSLGGRGSEQNVPGLGDSALWKSSGRLVVCTDQAVVALNIDNSPHDPDQNMEAAITMARLILERL